MKTPIIEQFLKVFSLILSSFILYFYFTQIENSINNDLQNKIINQQTTVQNVLWKRNEFKKLTTERFLNRREEDLEMKHLHNFFYEIYQKKYNEIKALFDQEELNNTDIKNIQTQINTLQKVTQDTLYNLAKTHSLYSMNEMNNLLLSLEVDEVSSEFDLRMNIQNVLNQLIINLKLINEKLLSVMSGNILITDNLYQPFLHAPPILLGKTAKLELILARNIDDLYHLEMSINDKELFCKNNIGHLELPIKDRQPKKLKVKAKWDNYSFTRNRYKKGEELEQAFTIYPR